MRKALIFLSIIFFSLELNGQTDEYYDPDDRPKFYLGVGTGINSYTGIAGFSVNYVIDKTLFFQGGLGLSVWGIRASAGIRYDRSYRNGFTFGINLANSTGIDDIDLELETSNGATQEVNMRLENAPTINLKTGYNWWLNDKWTFNLTIGYSFAFKKQPWVVKDGSVLSATSQQVMQLVAPGGLILGTGLSYGF